MLKEMIALLEKEEVQYTDEQVKWLIDHIGNKSPQIRDEVVYNSLAKGIWKQSFTIDQFSLLKDETMKQNLIIYRIEQGLPATLTRSFSALLNGALVQADANRLSICYQQLNEAEREYFFDMALNYLKVEHDRTGYSSKYGWVHAFAHGADYLTSIMGHEKFNLTNIPEILSMFETIFKTFPAPFIDDEESRLALAIYQGIVSGKIEQEIIACWLGKVSFTLEEEVDYYRLASFKHFLAAIYFRLVDDNMLEKNLNKELMRFLGAY